MNDLREDLDQALRTVTVSEAPVEQARRHGRRIRARRRVALLGGALAIAAVAAGYPALTGAGAGVGRTSAPAVAKPSPKPIVPSDMVITAGPPGQTTEAPGGLTSTTGEVAVGTVGALDWRVTITPPDPKNPVPAAPCYTVTMTGGGDLEGACHAMPIFLPYALTNLGDPVAFTDGRDGTNVATVGEVAQDVAFFIVTFDDGQQLKLIPVSVRGYRYIAWVAPRSVTTVDVIAHRGGPYSDSGQILSTAPFDLPGQLPRYGLWQSAGQAAPPRDAKVIGHGTAAGHAWRVTGYEGPWGTCFVADPEVVECTPVDQIFKTGVLGDWDGRAPGPTAYGSAAPGVTLVRIRLSDATTVTVRPVLIGDENLFAFAFRKDALPTSWIAYDASGKQVGVGPVQPGAVSPPVSASR